MDAILRFFRAIATPPWGLKYVTDRYRSKSNSVSINAKAALII
jgi:hypothetical protein